MQVEYTLKRNDQWYTGSSFVPDAGKAWTTCDLNEAISRARDCGAEIHQYIPDSLTDNDPWQAIDAADPANTFILNCWR